MRDREYLILLNLVPEVGSTRLRSLLDAFSELSRVVSASARQLQQVRGIGPQLAQRIVEGCRDTGRLQEELALAAQGGVRVVTLEEPEYPALLRQIHDPPLVLYIRGTLPLQEPAVAVVGSRRASHYGLQTAERLAYDLALRGVTVVSGLARGIDGAAHRGTLRAGGSTIAVLGGGLSRPYPPEHQALAEQIAARRGAVISEYPMTMEPLAQNFPRRNRVVSGLSLGVVVVEAAARSGALITADVAAEQGREVFAVPGAVTTPTSYGTHELLKQGARLVTSADDILDELRLRPEPRAQSAPAASSAGPPEALSDRVRRVLGALDATQPRYIDQVAGDSGLASGEAASLLLELEVKRLVRQLPGKHFVRQ